jgi:hypothetical protein
VLREWTAELVLVKVKSHAGAFVRHSPARRSSKCIHTATRGECQHTSCCETSRHNICA